MLKFNSDLSQTVSLVSLYLAVLACFEKYPVGTSPQISLMLTEFLSKLLCSEIKRAVLGRKLDLSTPDKWRRSCTHLCVKRQRLNSVRFKIHTTTKQQQQKMTWMEEIYPQVLNFIMHWPNLWHFCMILGFSSSWRGKQRRYLRYSVRDFLQSFIFPSFFLN